MQSGLMKVMSVSACAAMVAVAVSASETAAQSRYGEPYGRYGAAPPIWQGIYAGVHAGYGTAKWSGDDPSNSERLGGALGGAHLGYNFQSGSVVAGIEADYSFAGLSARPASAPDVKLSASGIGSLRGRLGYASGNALFYGTAGYAWLPSSIADPSLKLTATGGGLIVGGGVDYKFNPNMSLRGEVLHTFAHTTFSDGVDTARLSTPTTVFRAGISFHMN